jgi:hypothetical protein
VVSASVVDDDDLKVVGYLPRRDPGRSHHTGNRAGIIIRGKENRQSWFG